jgi:hypothetical protein
LINEFTRSPVLALPDFKSSFRLIVDTSNFAIGGILEQPDAFARWHPVAFLSGSLNKTEQDYPIHDKELCLWHFRHYLEGREEPLEIWSDHNNLKYFMTKEKLNHRQAGYALLLSHFTFTILHKPGAYNKSDALSWCSDYKEGMAEQEDEPQALFLQKPIIGANNDPLDTNYFTVRAT